MAKYSKLVVVHGDDDHGMVQAIRAAVEELAPEEARDFNYDRLEGRLADPQTLATLADTPPMMAERRLIHISEAENLSKPAIAALATKLDEAAARKVAETAFLLCYTVGKKPPKDIISRAGRDLKRAAPKPWEAERWVLSHAREQHGLALSQKVAAQMVATAGADTGVLASEVRKLLLLSDDGRISDELALAAMGQTAGKTAYDLLDALAARQFGECRDILENVLRQPATTGVGVAVVLSYQLIEMTRMRASLDAGRGAKVEPGWQDWQIKRIQKRISGWTLEELEDVLEALRDADQQMKRGTPDIQALSHFLVRACEPETMTTHSRPRIR
jgi:DNA polymerase III subunit delta